MWLLIKGTQEQATEDSDWLPQPEGSTLNKWAVEPPGKANARTQVQVPPHLQEKFAFDVALGRGLEHGHYIGHASQVLAEDGRHPHIMRLPKCTIFLLKQTVYWPRRRGFVFDWRPTDSGGC